MPTPKLTKAELREQLEAALANYSGPVTRCPPGTPPQDDFEQRRLDRALRKSPGCRLSSDGWRLAGSAGARWVLNSNGRKRACTETFARHDDSGRRHGGGGGALPVLVLLVVAHLRQLLP